MGPYDDAIAEADDHYANRMFKEAHIAYGRALGRGGTRDQYCRRMRGICSRLVAEQRLAKAGAQPEQSQGFLKQAARWLTKSEAYLGSAAEQAPDDERGELFLEQAHTEEVMARFLMMSGADPHRRLAAARAYREQGLAILSEASGSAGSQGEPHSQ